jgi:hypothetical protein
MVIVTPASRELLRSPSNPQTNDRREHRQYVVPRQHAKPGERKTDERADQRSQKTVARGGDRGTEVRLQHDDGADRAPVAVVQAESLRQPPAQRGGQRSLRGVNQQPLALPGEEAGILLLFHAQLDRKLLLGVRFVGFQAHWRNPRCKKLI